jgi:hypothetical protein
MRMAINIQWPWSQLIMSGKKTVELRKYPLPKKLINKPLLLIETPGPKGKKYAGIKRAKIIGIVVFECPIKYKNKNACISSVNDHLVHPSILEPRQNSEFWAWKVKKIKKIKKEYFAPSIRGQVFCRI